MSIWTRCRGAVVRIDDPGPTGIADAGDNNFRSGRAAVGTASRDQTAARRADHEFSWQSGNHRLRQNRNVYS